jgi:hypothetical protein
MANVYTPRMPRGARTLLVVTAAGVALIALVGIAIMGAMTLVFSIVTTVVNVRVETTVLDRGSGKPVPNCLLGFAESHLGISPAYDQHINATRTDPEGHVVARSPYSFSGLPVWSLARARDPVIRFYLGEAPRYDSLDEVETWEVRLHFREPWRNGVDLVPAVELKRFMAHDEFNDKPARKNSRGAEFAPLPPEPNVEVKALIRVQRDGERPLYRVSLTVPLNPAQIAACQAPPRT